MSLELEIINLYELYKEVERLGGTVHDVNVDCVICTFKDDKLPFTVKADGNVEGYVYDNENKVHKYKLVSDCNRIKQQKLPRWFRTRQYEYNKPTWNITNDTGDNNFQPMVEQILDGNQSINIEGRAGTGKSTFIKTLHKGMDKRNKQYISLAPTNKACRIN
jgi:transcriptional regulator with PAS, ATPase and Fis domain